MKLSRRRFLHLAAGAAALPAVSRIARAQTYPTRPITMIIPGAAGGIADTLGRILAERMRQSLKQPIIVDNVSGADGSIAAGRSSRAKPDGYTIELGSLGNHVLNGAVYALQYDVLNDFAAISPLVMTPMALFARRSIPATDVSELITWLKANPSRVTIGVSFAVYRILSAFLQKEAGDATDLCTLSWQRSGNAGLGGRPNRLAFRHIGCPATDTGR